MTSDSDTTSSIVLEIPNGVVTTDAVEDDVRSLLEEALAVANLEVADLVQYDEVVTGLGPEEVGEAVRDMAEEAGLDVPGAENVYDDEEAEDWNLFLPHRLEDYLEENPGDIAGERDLGFIDFDDSNQVEKAQKMLRNRMVANDHDDVTAVIVSEGPSGRAAMDDFAYNGANVVTIDISDRVDRSVFDSEEAEAAEAEAAEAAA